MRPTGFIGPTSAAMSDDSASEVSGPVATMTGFAALESGIAVTSSRTIVMSGCDAIAAVMASANLSRSTASAAPAGTRLSSATRMTSDPRRRISSFKRPTALSSLSPRNELLHTSSARRSVLWTAVGRTGRISWSVTATPCDPACQAASDPARPPPMILIIFSFARGAPPPRACRRSLVRARRCSMRCLLSGRFDELFRTRVIAIVVVAEDLTAVLLRRLLDQVRRAALGTLLLDRTVPEHEVAIGVIGAAEEDLAAARFALDDLAALVGVLRTQNARRLVLDVLALGVIGAGGEFAEAPLLDDEIRSAARALLVEDLIRLGRLQAPLLGRNQLPRRLALGVSRAREELAEASALEDHRLAAVLARLDLLFAAFRFRLLLLELTRVRALRIRAARDEGAELADLDQHRRSAALADLVGLHAFLEVLHLLAGAREILLVLLVELLERVDVIGLPLLDLVEILFEVARVGDVDDVVEALGQEIGDHHAEHRRLEAPVILADVVAVLEHADDRGVGARTADAVFLELQDRDYDSKNDG